MRLQCHKVWKVKGFFENPRIGFKSKMKRQVKKLKRLILLMLLIIAGCSNSTREDIDREEKTKEGVYRIEEEYLEKDLQDAVGLALSGGGVRSASFNIGVMGGLYEAGILEELDYISSVSGGGYAAYWYYTKLRWDQGEREDFFRVKPPEAAGEKDRYRFQEYLENNIKMGTYSSDIDHTPVEKVKTVGAVTWRSLYAIPFSVAEIFQVGRIAKENYSPVPVYFRNSIERVYGFYPAHGTKDLSPKGGSFVNRGKDSWRLERFGYEELQEIYEGEEKVPLWIVNTTADVNNPWPRWKNAWIEPPSLEEAVFEFTPFYYGNDLHGYRKSRDLEEVISHYVQISGAALDSANPYNLRSGGIMLSAVSMGNYVDTGEEMVYLTDGGHSENLGAYSLIRRGIGKVIISDAEYGVGGRLTGLIRLLQNIEEEYEFSFENKVFDAYLRDVLKEAHGEKRGKIFNKERPLPEDLPLILKGEVVEKRSGRKTEIYYLKLVMARDSILEDEDFHRDLAERMRDGREDEPLVYENATTDMWFSPEEYKYYFFLGEYLGRTLDHEIQG